MDTKDRVSRLVNENRLTFEDIYEAVEKVFGVPKVDVLSASRVTNIVSARHAFMYVARVAMGQTYTAIGKEMGKDHATVLVALKSRDRRGGLKRSSDQVNQVLSILKTDIKISTKNIMEQSPQERNYSALCETVVEACGLTLPAYETRAAIPILKFLETQAVKHQKDGKAIALLVDRDEIFRQSCAGESSEPLRKALSRIVTDFETKSVHYLAKELRKLDEMVNPKPTK